MDLIIHVLHHIVFQSFNGDLNEKRNAVKDIINKCNKMLRETTNAQTDEIKSRLESIKAQVNRSMIFCLTLYKSTKF